MQFGSTELFAPRYAKLSKNWHKLNSQLPSTASSPCPFWPLNQWLPQVQAVVIQGRPGSAACTRVQSRWHPC